MTQTIELSDEQYAALQNGEDVIIKAPEKKVVPWEPEGGSYYVGSTGTFHTGISQPSYKEYGVERVTRKVAEKAAKAMRTFNRLLAYRDEFDPDFLFDATKYNWFVYFNFDSQKYSWSYARDAMYIGQVYMSKPVAIELVEKLNNKEVVL